MYKFFTALEAFFWKKKFFFSWLFLFLLLENCRANKRPPLVRNRVFFSRGGGAYSPFSGSCLFWIFNRGIFYHHPLGIFEKIWVSIFVDLKSQSCKSLRKREFLLFLCFFLPATDLTFIKTIIFRFTLHEMNLRVSLCRKQNGTFLISFTRTREALNIYFTNKVLKHDEEKTVLFQKIWTISVLLSRVFMYTFHKYMTNRLQKSL